jgi:serine protease Do
MLVSIRKGRCMKTRTCSLLLFMVMITIAVSAQTTAAPKPPPANAGKIALIRDFSGDVQNLTRIVGRSVVQISANGYSLESQSEHGQTSLLQPERSTGSGVILSSDGLIMTNSHVVTGASRLRVRLVGLEQDQGFSANNRQQHRGALDAKLIGMDRQTDLALIKVEAHDLPFLTLADSAEVKQGQVVLAFGSPFGLENSVSMGIVSSPARQIDPDNPMIYVQTDAAINPGNSGGPLVDVDGHVIGINTFILSQSGGSEGLSFAIPSNIIRSVFTQLRKDGHVHRGQIGIRVRSISSELAQGLGLPNDQGVLVEDVLPGGPADQAGMQIGDVIVAFGDHPILNVRQFAVNLYRFNVGDLAHITVMRKGQKTSLEIPVSEQKNDPDRFADMITPSNIVPQLGVYGLSVDKPVAAMLPDLRISSGVVVAARGANADYFGDRPNVGDVIHGVNGAPVTSINDLKEKLSALKPEDPLVLQIERESVLAYLVLQHD